MNDFLLWVSTLLCLIVITALQYRLFGSTIKTRSQDSVATFFLVDELLDNQQRTFLALLSSIPLSFIFLVVAYNAETFGKALIEIYVYSVKEHLATDSPVGPALVTEIPEPLYPVVILLASFLLFGAQLKFLYMRVEKGLVFAAGALFRADRQLKELADILLGKHEYEDLVAELNRERPTPVPLAEELEHTSATSQLSFQLLHLAKYDVPKLGLRDAVLRVVHNKFQDILSADDRGKLDHESHKDNNLKELLVPNRPTRWSYVVAGLVVYLVVCGVYAWLVPMASRFVEGPVWPKPEFTPDLVRGIIQATVATLAPLVLGIAFYAQRALNVSETQTQRLFIVFAQVFVISVVFNILFVLLPFIEMYLGLREGSQSFGLPEFVYVLTHSLIPCAALLTVAIVDRDVILSRRNVFLAVLMVGIGHFAAYFAYELASELNWAYYWHQALLGTVVASTGLVIMAIFWKPTKRTADGRTDSEEPV